MTGRILVADATATNRILLSAALEPGRYRVEQAASLDELRRCLRREPADLVIADAALMTGASATQVAGLAAPVLVLAQQAAQVAPMLALGVEEILCRPVSPTHLLARIRAILREHRALGELRRRGRTAQTGFAEAPPTFASPGRVAMVGTPGGDLASLPARRVEAGELLSRVVGSFDVVVVVIPGDGPEASLTLIAELRCQAVSQSAEVVAICPPDRPDIVAQALDLGAAETIATPTGFAEAQLRILRRVTRKREADHLRKSIDTDLRLARFDPLTGLLNRREAERRLALPSPGGFALVIADIDRFKRVNDALGHATGDTALKAVAKAMTGGLPDTGFVSRIGGDEFLIRLDCGRAEALVATVETLRRHIAGVTAGDGDAVTRMPVSVSLGAALAAPGETPDDVWKRADAALYRAKRRGRNRVEFDFDAGPGDRQGRRGGRLTEASSRSA